VNGGRRKRFKQRGAREREGEVTAKGFSPVELRALRRYADNSENAGDTARRCDPECTIHDALAEKIGDALVEIVCRKRQRRR
jgi:hypothetical protein